MNTNILNFILALLKLSVRLKLKNQGSRLFSIRSLFQLAVDCFEYLDTMLKLVRSVKDGLSGTAQFSPQMIQCRLHPYICIVPESYNLYG